MISSIFPLKQFKQASEREIKKRDFIYKNVNLPTDCSASFVLLLIYGKNGPDLLFAFCCKLYCPIESHANAYRKMLFEEEIVKGRTL